jgi:glycosyltransferase involved in cell wall biosynthesis
VTERPLVSIVAPFYNEERTLPELLRRLVATVEQQPQYAFEFIFIDDGSSDASLVTARRLVDEEPRLRVVELRRNYGQTAALQAGLDAAEGEIIISLDADLQHFPEDIPKFLAKIEAGSDVVCGWRAQRREGIVRRWPSTVANALIRRVSGLTVHDIGTTFRAYRREIVRDFKLLGENHRFVPVFARIVGARIDEVPIENIVRPHGESNYGLGRSLSVLFDLAFIYFFARYADRPIRIFGKIALLTMTTGMIIATALLTLWLLTGRPVVREHSGWFMVSSLLMLTSLQLVLTGVIAEFMARLYYAPRERSSYQIRRTWRQP